MHMNICAASRNAWRRRKECASRNAEKNDRDLERFERREEKTRLTVVCA